MPTLQDLQDQIDALNASLSDANANLQEQIGYNLTLITQLKNQLAGGTKVQSGEAGRSLGAASSVQTIAHNLGKVPKLLEITGFTNGAEGLVGTTGTYNGTLMSYVSVYTPNVGWGTGSIVFFSDGTNKYNATVTMDAANIYISWTLTAAGFASSLHFIWKVIG